jgi:hypothetical protein
MPRFYADDLDIGADEYLSVCSTSDIKELIDALVKDGYIRKSDILSETKMSAGEQVYENKLDKLHGKWNRLSEEDEETIIKIADKF